jgi:hypothetical protein
VAAKRFFLAVFSLVGVISYAAMTGDSVAPKSITSLIETAI